VGLCAGAFMGGVLAVLLAPALATPAGLAAVAVAGCGAACARRGRWLTFFCAGFLLCHAAAAPQLQRRQAEDERALLHARIVSIPVRDGDLLRFDAELRDARGLRPVQRARLAWRLHGARAANESPLAADEWRLALKLRAPRAAVNPGAVDVERNLFRDRIDVLGEVIESRLNERVARHPHSLLGLREDLVRWIDAVVDERSAAALLAALAVGATGEVSREQWRIFNATGITHLVAISGLHVTLFAWLAMRCTAWAWRHAARLGVRVRRDSATAAAGVAFATAYALLAGFSVPTQRTLAMLCLFLLWRSRARAAPLSASLGLSLVLVLLLDPFAPLGAGLWLSFGTVGAILLAAGTRLLPGAPLAQFLALQFWVTVALLPATLAVFGSVSVAGLLVNLVAIPLFSFLLVPLVLGATALHLLLPAALQPLPVALLRIAASVIDASWPLFADAADWSFALWRAAPGGLEYLLALAALGIVLCPWGLALRASTALLLAPVATAPAGPERGVLQLHVLDVGQGLSVLLRTANHSLLFDTGDSFRSDGAQAERVVVPFAAARGLRTLDLLVLPRVSIDAGAGVTVLQAQLRARRIVAGTRAPPLPPEFEPCATAGAWEWDGLQFELQSVPEGSCVLQVRGAAGSVLLTGDLAAADERELLERGLRPTDVVVVPRHAAASASSAAFVAQLRPRWALASLRASARQSAAFARVSARWQASGASMLDTASAGALSLELSPGRPPAPARAARLQGWGLWRLP
jgi:competence protein ComEC